MLRILPPHNFVFGTDPVRFTGVDAYFYMRQVDSLVHNFPAAITFDPYLRFNWGMNLGTPHIFVLLMGTLSWLFTLGNTTQSAMDNFAVYLPTVFGALTVIPVYFAAKALLNKWAGLIAAAVIAVLPGEFLGRSILGFADRHVFDNLLIAVCLTLYILSFRAARESHFALISFAHGGWKTQGRALTLTALSGIFMGLFVLDWKGSVLFLLIVAAYVAIQSFINHLRGLPSGHLWLVSSLSVVITGAISIPSNLTPTYLVPLLIVFITGPALALLTWVFGLLKTRRYVFPLVSGSAIFLVGIVLGFAAPTLFEPIIGSMNLFSIKDTEFTVLEMQPILLPGGKLSGDIVWGNFTTGIFITLIGLVVMAWRLIRRTDPEETLLFLIWTLFVLVATIYARRFAQILSPNVAILTGYVCALSLYFFNLNNTKDHDKHLPEKPPNVHIRANQPRPWSKIVRISLAVIVIFFAAVFPNLGPSSEIAAQPAFAPDEGWLDALKWLRSNSPEPFGEDRYYEQYPSDFKYPSSAYSVISWWDYGYWIVRISHRLPFCDPGGGGREAVAKFLTSQDETSGSKYASSMGGRYVVLDSATAIGKFHAVLTYAKKPQNRYFEEFILREKSATRQVMLWYPDYYRSMTARLYNFDAREVAASRAVAIGYTERPGSGGTYKEITSVQVFTKYDDASAWVATQKGGQYVIGSDDPFASPVSLSALATFKMVHGSPQSLSIGEKKTTPSVKVFQYQPIP